MSELFQSVIDDNGLASIFIADTCYTQCPFTVDEANSLVIDEEYRTTQPVCCPGACPRGDGMVCSSLTLATLPNVMADILKVIGVCEKPGDTGQWTCPGTDVQINCEHVCDGYEPADCHDGADEEKSFCAKFKGVAAGGDDDNGHPWRGGEVCDGRSGRGAGLSPPAGTSGSSPPAGTSGSCAGRSPRGAGLR